MFRFGSPFPQVCCPDNVRSTSLACSAVSFSKCISWNKFCVCSMASRNLFLTLKAHAALLNICCDIERCAINCDRRPRDPKRFAWITLRSLSHPPLQASVLPLGPAQLIERQKAPAGWSNGQSPCVVTARAWLAKAKEPRKAGFLGSLKLRRQMQAPFPGPACSQCRAFKTESS